MKKIFFFSAIFFLVSCHEKRASENPSEDLSQCIYKPFQGDLDSIPLYRNSQKIEVRAYVHGFDELTKQLITDSLAMRGIEAPDLNLEENCEESIFLNTTQKDSLFHLLLGMKGTSDLMEAAACYSPRHKILFYDSRDSVSGHIDICFSCNQARWDVDEFDFVCNDQLTYYKKFFKWCGLTKGFRN